MYPFPDCHKCFFLFECALCRAATALLSNPFGVGFQRPVRTCSTRYARKKFLNAKYISIHFNTSYVLMGLVSRRDTLFTLCLHLHIFHSTKLLACTSSSSLTSMVSNNPIHTSRSTITHLEWILRDFFDPSSALPNQ